MLTVNEHVFGNARELVCFSVALLLHIPIYFWHARPGLGPLGDPITEIDFTVEEAEKPTPPPPEKESASFVERVKKAVGLATPAPLPKLVVPQKPVQELMGTSTETKIKPSVMAEALQKQTRLVEKDRSLSKAFDVGKIETKGPGLAGMGLGPGDKMGGGTLKERSSAFKIAAGDLPFAVKKGAGGAGLVSDGDAPQIALSNKTDKRIKSVSTAFFGAGGGTGGGEGSGEGGGGALKDKSGGRGGLVGVSGGFSAIGEAGGTRSSGGGLSGVSGDGGRGASSGGGGGKIPYEISGPLFGRGILFQVLPPFPDWAREKGIIATVAIDFFVRSSGQVNPNKTVVFRGSGYPKLDAMAVEALSQWVFEELTNPALAGKEQSGRITFKFKAL